ncbi:DUF397 domain-containing protein [Streptomyces bohaiensis]|uniref:DUF397 domain-containing protein n=1 Tax=Streptomyces bohaiensis TaxID=1431344 RepID=A0ABX1CCU6_9ACTN|nr:DUF397 domain-containing protein [Streptomyces bohaiensis]NJQ15695.1 DUF397 domain-containing protein [Streptomyces bohaiensis]
MTSLSSTDLRWLTSTYSDNGGACVQVSADLAATEGTVPIRDSKAPADAVLSLSTGAFAAFVGGVRAGRLT